MAFLCFRRYLNNSYISLSSRRLGYFFNSQKCLQFSTSEKISAKNGTPVKYTTSKGAEIPIEEIIFSKSNTRKNAPKYEKFVILVSIAVFYIYFCIIREENDIDEILKGNTQYVKNSNAELINLKLKLIYCEQNNLPTGAIKAQIAEIEMKNNLKA